MENILYIFTDGAATKNGKKDCAASWAYCMRSSSCLKSSFFEESAGFVPDCEIPGEKYTASNNRGELMAILEAFKTIDHWMSFENHEVLSKHTNIVLVSDSEYSIKSITVWIKKWLTDAELLKSKKNIDLIVPAHQLYNKINTQKKLSISHIRSHKKAPVEEHALFLWQGNNRADELCTGFLAHGSIKK